jgi:hypothetical protein
VVPAALSEGPVRDALEVARTATFEPEEWEAYERSQMAEQDARGALAVAHQEGEATGTAKAILTVLAARGLAVDEAIRACVLRCSDAATLGRWLARAVTAASAEEAIETPSDPT